MGAAISWIMIIVSFLFTVSDIFLVIRWIVRPRQLKKRCDYSFSTDTGKHIMLFSLVLLFAIWTLRFAISSYVPPASDQFRTPWFERLPSSFLHALQTFSMDEDYTWSLEQGEGLINQLFHDQANPVIIRLFGIYISALNSVAPVAGGAFIFEILAGIFPQVYFYLSAPLWWKNRYFFSDLNEQSVALAKSIVSNPDEKHVQIVFADAYVDDENEEGTEMLLTAKALGAICLKDDLLHIPLQRLCRSSKEDRGKMRIFLSDRNENMNLQALAHLLEHDKQKILKNTEIFVFGADTQTTNIEDETEYICNRIRAEHGSYSITPRVIPVNGIRNLAQNLFYDLPLFECLYGKSDDDRQINLTIIGSGTIGTELFLNAYWFGQIVGVKLNINVVSKDETEEEFVSRIDFINPEIMRSAAAGDVLLDASVTEEKPNFQPEYFHFRFGNADVLTSQLETIMTEGIGNADDLFPLKDTDYFIIAAGSDEDNYTIADKIRQIIGCYHFHSAKNRKTIISYVVYSSSLCRTLNCCPRLRTVAGETDSNPHEFDIYMHAFGSMDEIFSSRNILFEGVKNISARVGKNYIGKDMPERTYSYYSERANRSRALHMIYKAFSAGAIQPTLFCSKNDAEYREEIHRAEKEYPQTVRAIQVRPQEDPSQPIVRNASSHALAWMEHRRWNAFMRINGFRCPENFTDYSQLDSDVHKKGVDKDYQFLFLKQHPCIVECATDGFSIPAEVREAGREAMDLSQIKIVDKLDKLSHLTAQVFKVFDYPEFEIPRKKEN